MSPPEASDPFGTGRRRAAILDAWSSSPTRFREDANAEEDLALGGYADRLLVELVQNAADAAARAGEPGIIRIALTGPADAVEPAGRVTVALSVANTGAPLDAAGVDSLTSLRASAKRDTPGAVGRFGVGFAAVLAVSDEPRIRSAGGGVRFSAAATRDAVAGDERLAAEVARRDGRVPVLRLPWPEPAAPPAGYATEVVLPLRDPAACRAALDAFDPALLLGLPAVREVRVGSRVLTRHDDGPDVLITDDGTPVRWRVRSASGTVPADLLADLPIEDRERTRWHVVAAVPAGGHPPLAGEVVHAPTPSEEPVGLPVRLIGTYPLDPSRRRVRPGPLTDRLTDHAADVLAELYDSLAATPAVLELLPRPGLPDGRFAAALAERLRDRLRELRLPAAAGGRVAAHRALSVPNELAEPLAGVLDGLLPAGWWSRHTGGALAALGVQRLGVPEIVAALTGIERPPGWWRGLYAALAALPLEPTEREALAALPVPLADGRTVTGPARVLLPDPALVEAGLSGVGDALGLLMAHPDAAHPLLERLGARPAAPAEVLRDDRVRAAVVGSMDAADPAETADAVLRLLAAAPIHAGWLADLALPDDTGAWCPAGDLLLPGSPLPDLLVADGPYGVLDPALTDRYDTAALTAAGVLDRFAIVDEADVDLVDAMEFDLDLAPEWVASVTEAAGGGPGLRVERLLAVRDLDLVRPDRWDRVLALLDRMPLRAVVAADCRVVTADGRRIAVPAYTRWWLARAPRVGGGTAPVRLRTDEPDSELAGLYDPLPGDPEFAALIGAHRGLTDLLTAAGSDPAIGADLLDRLADPARLVAPELLAAVYHRLAVAPAARYLTPPARLRVAPDLVVPADDAVVVDQPWLLDRLAGAHPVPGGASPATVADFLDVPLLSELPAR